MANDNYNGCFHILGERDTLPFIPAITLVQETPGISPHNGSL
jgi:hypothetical protein